MQLNSLIGRVPLALICAAQISCGSGASPPAAALPAALPAAVSAALDSVVAVCREAGGKAITAQAILHADLNADGRQDHVLDVGGFQCEGAAGIHGDREKEVRVFIADDAGATLAFSDSTFGARIEGEGAAATLWLTVTGASCGKPAARDFASEAFCDRALLWNSGAGTLGYAPVETARMIQ
jgi:hypothetical protein